MKLEHDPYLVTTAQVDYLLRATTREFMRKNWLSVVMPMLAGLDGGAW